MNGPAGASRGTDRSVDIVCLLPVRNGTEHLDRWFASVARFADAVVALDDGSTDDTRARLEAEPLVTELLTNPPRPTFHGWNDAENRQRLLDAAGSLQPGWVVQLDADEEISDDDAAALRVFVADERDHGIDAMSLPVHRMIGEAGEWDRIDNSPIRLFRWAPGQQLPSEELHLAPVPTAIPDDRRGLSTLRIRHYAGSDEARRQARYDKYGEVDPTRTWQRSYEHLLDAPGSLRAWITRPPCLPVVHNGRAAGAAARSAFDPAAMVGDLGPTESGRRAREAAHLDGWAIVTGTTENTNRRPAGWADYYVDHHQTLPGRPSAPLDAAPTQATVRGDAVAWLRLDDPGAAADAAAATPDLISALFDRGFGAYRVQEVPVRDGSPNRGVRDLVRFHYRRRRDPSTHIRELRRRYDVGELRRRNVVRSFAARSRRHLRDLVTGLRRWGSWGDRARAVAVAPLIALAYGAEFVGSVVAFRRVADESAST